MPNKSKILLFGLTADPFHLGHAAYIEACKIKFPHHLVVVMPCKINPIGKKNPQGEVIYPTSSEIRYDMLKLYFKHDPRVVVSRYEIDKQEPSYTIDTIHYLQHVRAQDLQKNKICPDWVVNSTLNVVSEVTLLLGTDNFFQLPRWHRWQEILQQTHLVVMQRAGYPQLTAEQIENEELRTYFSKKNQTTQSIGNMSILEGPQHNISSTEIKNMICNGADDTTLKAFLPTVIIDYIRKNIQQMSSLYRSHFCARY